MRWKTRLHGVRPFPASRSGHNPINEAVPRFVFLNPLLRFVKAFLSLSSANDTRWMKVVIASPQDYYGAMVELVKERRGFELEVQPLEDKNQVLISALIPWQEVVCDMNDQVMHS